MPQTTEPTIPPVRVRHRPRIAPIWVLPLVALAVGLWLVWRSLLDTGPRITLRFDSAEGIAVNQTQVRYKGIPLGVVRQLTVLPDLSGVEAEIQFEKQVEDIPADSQFWLVQPQISAAGISGLNTLFSGNYIAIQLGKPDAPAGTHFTALKTAPPLPSSTPGLHIQLEAERLGSIAPGTPIYYRQIPIGAVQSTAMSPDGKGVRMDVHIVPEHAKRVRKTSRFWNASGLKVAANLSGLTVETESLASLVSGGIAVSTNDEGAPPGTNGDRYTLFPDFEAAEAGLKLKIRFGSGAGLSEGVTKVMYKGMPAGKLLKLDYDEDSDMVVATVGMDPRTEPYVTDAARFWLVKPQLSVAGVSGLDALLTGAYISFAPDASGQSVREFAAADGPSPLDYREPGLHLLLTAKELGSLNQGSPVYHRQVQVGEVVSYTLDRERDKVDMHVLVKPEYRDLVNESTRFWNVSGVTLNASLSGVQLRTESLAALLAGGIAFDTPQAGATQVGNGYRFSLFKDEAAARARRHIRLRFSSAEGLTAGATRVIYRGLPIGLVDSVAVSGDFRTVDAVVGINPGAEHLLTTGSAFWLVRPELSASRVSGLDALFSGSYIAIQPGSGEPASEFLARSGPPPLPESEPGLHLVLEAPDAGSLTVGAPVLHKKLSVGTIQDVRLAPDGRRVLAHVHIQPEHAAAVTRASRFWAAGGVDLRGGVSGLKLRTESLAALIAGGIAFDSFDTPGGRDGARARNGERYRLYADRAQAELAGFPVSLRLASAEGLAVGTPIRYQGVDIGELSRLYLGERPDEVYAEAMFKPAARPLLREGSRIWRVKARLGLARTENLDTLVAGGYLALRAGTGAERFSFPVADEAPVLKTRPGGRNLVLEAASLGSLKEGDPLLYRQLKVGEVLGMELAGDGGQVRVYVHVPEAHAGLVRDTSRFWRASGLRLDAGLFSGLKLQSESLESLLSGGIAFANPEPGAPAGEGARFMLHAEADEDWLAWQNRSGPSATRSEKTAKP